MGNACGIKAIDQGLGECGFASARATSNAEDVGLAVGLDHGYYVPLAIDNYCENCINESLCWRVI